MVSLQISASVALALCLVASFQHVDANNGFIDRIQGKALFETVKLWTHEYPVEARTIFEGMATKYVIDEKEKQGYIEALDDVLVQPLAEDSSGCRLCQLLFGLLKVALRTSNYTDIEPNLIYYCEFLLVAIDQRIQAKELCGGIIPLQAPHVCKTVTTPPVPSSRESCEFLNSCLPPFSRQTESPKWMQKSQPVHQQPLPSNRRNKATPLRVRRQKPSAFAPTEGVIKIAQLTDIHLEKDYATNSLTECWLPVCCQTKYGPGDSLHYGDYKCNIPQRTMEHFFSEVNKLAPDFVIFTGDIPPHTMWDETLESQLNCTVTLTETLGRIIKTPIYPCIGNHEMYPTNLFSREFLHDATPHMLNEFTRLWTPLANFTEQETQTMRDSGFYTKLLNYDKLRLVVMNTLYMYTANFYNVLNHNRFNSSEAENLKNSVVDALTQARINNEKVIFLGHHVPGNSDFIVRQSHWYQDLMANFSDVIILHMSGHTHSDEFRLFNHKNGSVASMVYVSPSIDSHDFRNPSMRIYYLNQTTYDVLDYEQYYFDIKNVSSGSDVSEPKIVRLYSALADYGLSDLSPKSWLGLLDRFRTDSGLLQKHRSNSNAKAKEYESYGNCTGKCVEDYICRMLHSSYDDYLDCVNPAQTPAPTSTITWPIITGQIGPISAAPSAFNQPPLQLKFIFALAGLWLILQSLFSSRH